MAGRDRAVAGPTLTIVGHAVHRSAVVGGPGGDVSQAWREANGATIEWQTFGVEAANERAFREASLAEGNVDIVFILDRYTGPQFAGMFEDLQRVAGARPDPGVRGNPEGDARRPQLLRQADRDPVPPRDARAACQHGDPGRARRGRAAEERGGAGRGGREADATRGRTACKVYGLVINLDDPATPIDWVRGFGGDFITQDYRVVVDEPGAVRAMTVMRDLFRKGVLPRNSMNLKTEDLITFMQQGRAAMTNNPFGRYFNYNDPKASKYPGKIAVGDLPLGVDGKPIPAKTSVWAMAIPRNGRNKELAWSLIKHLSTPDSTLREALNGNGPVRPSVYADPKLQAVIPYAAAEAAALGTARLVDPRLCRGRQGDGHVHRGDGQRAAGNEGAARGDAGPEGAGAAAAAELNGRQRGQGASIGGRLCSEPRPDRATSRVAPAAARLGARTLRSGLAGAAAARQLTRRAGAAGALAQLQRLDLRAGRDLRGPGELRQAAARPDLLAGVLEHLRRGQPGRLW